MAELRQIYNGHKGNCGNWFILSIVKKWHESAGNPTALCESMQPVYTTF